MEARAEFVLLKWPTENSHALWIYTKKRETCPGVGAVIDAELSLFTKSFPWNSSPCNTRFPQVPVTAHCSLLCNDSGREELGQEQDETSQDPLAILHW